MVKCREDKNENKKGKILLYHDWVFNNGIRLGEVKTKYMMKNRAYWGMHSINLMALQPTVLY